MNEQNLNDAATDRETVRDLVAKGTLPNHAIFQRLIPESRSYLMTGLGWQRLVSYELYKETVNGFCPDWLNVILCRGAAV